MRLGLSLPGMHPFKLNLTQLTRNILITGSVGTGKTNTIYKIIENLYHQGIPFLAISVAKKDMRNLIKKFPDIQVIPAEKFRINLLEREDWSSLLTTISDFSDIYSHEIEVLLRSKSYIVKVVKELWDIFERSGEKSESPNIEDMLSLLYGKSSTPVYRRDDFILKNIQRIEMVLILTNRILRWSKGFSLEKILEHPVILELDNLSDTVINLIMISLLTKILRYRVEKGIRGKLLHCIIIDEAKRIFSHVQEKNINLGIPPIDYLVSYARELGEGIISADQEVSKLTDTIIACSNTKISFMLGGKDILEAKMVFGLNDKQLEVLRQLPCGVALVKMDERYLKPFLVQMDYLEIKKDVTDEEVEEHSREFIEELNKDVRPRSRILIERIKKEEKTRIITKEEENFVINVAKRPDLMVLERFKSIGLSNYMGTKILKSLSFKGFIRKAKIYTAQRGNQPIILEITDKGKEYLNSIGIKIQSKGKGGAVHQWWQKKIQEFYKKRGHIVVIEPNTGGANTDVLIFESEDKRIAVEVALSSKGQSNNIQRDLKYFDRVIIASETKALMERIKTESMRIINKEEFKRVRFCLLQDFYHEI